MRRIAPQNARAQQISKCNSKDFFRAMVEMNHQVCQTKATVKVQQTLLDLLGNLIDEKV